MNRRAFMQMLMAGLSFLPACRIREDSADAEPLPPKPPSADAASKIFWVKDVPDLPFANGTTNHHAGIDALLALMGRNELSFYKQKNSFVQSEAYGLIAADDVVLIKVNAQWKHRGCTNSDLVRGLIQCILEHPDGFSGEVVIVENGQGRGSLNCDTSSSYNGDRGVYANANDASHSFLYLVQEIFRDQPVSARLLDPLRNVFIGPQDHLTEGFRRHENVSYPCFTTERGRRVELREGIWNGSAYQQNLKLINVPVLKHHDVNGSEITAALKHFYGLVSMSDGYSGERHYLRLGETCGKMVASVRAPALHVVDAIWVSHRALGGYPADMTFRANQVLASQDPVALDHWAAKYVLYPHDGNVRHHPDFAGITAWLDQARETINNRGGIFNPGQGIRVGNVTRDEAAMRVFASSLG